jgi:formate dehydrogenase subunit gamma
MNDANQVTRFTLRERTIHWMVALSFLYAALTGLSLWSPRLYWLAAVFGGGVTIRAWHPLGGLLFAAIFSVMFLSWRRHMRIDGDDRKWLRLAHRYAAHDYGALPEAGRFNGGQKSLFWLQTLNGLLLILSGIVLWWPQSMSRPLREGAILLHPAAGILAVAGLIVHIYMGTAATPGAFRGMTQGWVKRGWAASHHAKWYREIDRQ